MLADREGMTDFSAAHIGIQYRPGKHNLASAAFADLQTARREGRTPEGSQVSFGDLIDTLNPLQHIPVVAEAYRSMTGDGISPQARIAGGALWGGPVGLVTSIAGLAIAGGGDESFGDRLYASLLGEGNQNSDPIALAQAETEDVSLEAGKAELTTASIVTSETAPRPAASTADGAKPLPRMSPEAFQALIGSFADPALEGSPDGAPPGGEPRQRPDLASAMLEGLEKYEAMKAVRLEN